MSAGRPKIAAGHLNRRIRFRQRGLDANGDRLGDFADVCTRFARIQTLTGGEAVQAQRMAGQQPVLITVRRDSATRQIDNAFEAVDDHDASVAWDIAAATPTEDRAWIEILAVQRRGEAVV